MVGGLRNVNDRPQSSLRLHNELGCFSALQSFLNRWFRNFRLYYGYVVDLQALETNVGRPNALLKVLSGRTYLKGQYTSLLEIPGGR